MADKLESVATPKSFTSGTSKAERLQIGATRGAERYASRAKQIKVNGKLMSLEEWRERVFRRAGIEEDNRSRLIVCSACGEKFLLKLPKKIVKRLEAGKIVPDAEILFVGVGAKKKSRMCSRRECRKERRREKRRENQRRWRTQNPEAVREKRRENQRRRRASRKAKK